MGQLDAPGRPWWLRGPTGQTLWARLVRSRHPVRFEREVLTTEDDDDLVLDHGTGPAGAPRLLILHGLEGSAHSPHAQWLAVQAARVGWRCTVLNFRSCARDPARISRRLPNRRPRLYHSGETGDLDFVVRTLAARAPEVPLYAVGFSLAATCCSSGWQRWARRARSSAPPPSRSPTIWRRRRAIWSGRGGAFTPTTSCGGSSRRRST